MKKILSVIIILSCLICLLSSCNTEPSRRSKNSLSKNNRRIEIYFPESTLSIPSDERVEIWEDYMQSKYGVDINLQYINKSRESYIDVDELLKLSEGEGLIIVNSYSMLKELISKDMIMSVNFYQDTLNDYKNINPGMIDSLTDSLGNLWGVPLRKGDPLIDKRTYNKEWLDAIGVPVPESIDEFYDYAVFVAFADPDGNGVNDTYIAEYTDRDLFSQFRDVFKAFGCYPSISSPIGFNPLNMQVENFITDGNIIEAMEFIKALEDQGLIINSEAAEHNYKVASSMGYWTQEYETERAYGFYLTGPNEKMLIEERYPEGCLAVLKHTDNPKDKLDALYELIYSSTDSYMDFAYGIKGEDYFDMIDHYIVKTVSDNPQELITYRIGIITDLSMPGLDVKPPIFSNNPGSKVATEKRLDIVAESWDASEAAYKLLSTDLSYRVDFNIYSDDSLTDNSDYVYRLRMVNDILVNDILIEDAVEEYKRHIRN